MAKLVSKHCPTCGAPLPFAADARQVVCQYCGNLIHIEWTRQVPQPQGPSMTLYVKPPNTGAVTWIIVLTTLLPVLFGGAISAISAISTMKRSQAIMAQVGAGANPTSVAETFPVTCGMNQRLEIVGKTFTGSGTLVTGNINCKLLIKDCQLTGDVVVEAEHLIEVTIENSTLVGRDAALKLGSNSKVKATRNSVIRGREAGILGGLNLEVSLTDSRAEGEEVGIRTESNLKLDTKNSTLVGKDYGVRSGSSMKLNMTGGTVSGVHAALSTDSNLELAMRGGVMQGTEIAVLVSEYSADLRLSHGVQIVAREAAVKVGSNLKMEVEDSLIDGREVGVDVANNLKLKLGPKGKIHGGSIGIRAGYNVELSMRQASLQSEAVAFCGAHSMSLESRGSTITGSKDALRLERKPNGLSLTDTKVTGNLNYAGGGCSLADVADRPAPSPAVARRRPASTPPATAPRRARPSGGAR